MSKKSSKAKAKRARAKARPPAQRITAPRNAEPWMGVLHDPKTGKLFDPITREPIPERPPQPPPTAEHIAARRLARDEAKRVAFRARLARRPAEMQRDGYVLPADVAVFLRRLHDEPTFYSDEVQISTARAIELVAAAYMEGCREGFIEGFLYGEDKARPGALKNRERLRQQNLEKLERLGIADRNAEIVAKFHQMERDLPGKEQRYEELAARHELTTRQIGTIIRKASTRRR
jgi:hypothetical protein